MRPMNEMARRVVGVCCVGLLAACSTDVFTAPDGGSDANVDDGGNGVDVVEDVGTIDDGSGDASDGGVAFTCNPEPQSTILCDDFESSSDPGGKFVSTFLYGGGAVAFDTTNFVSPTHAVTFTAPVISSTPAFADFLSEGTSVTNTTISLRSQLRIHQIDTTQNVSLMRVSYAAAAANGHVTFDVIANKNALALAVSQPTVDGGVVTPSAFALTGYVIDKWVSVRIDITTSPAVSVSAYIGASQVLASTPVAVTPPSSNDKVRDANIGIIYLQNSSVATSVDFDNFLFRGM